MRRCHCRSSSRELMQKDVAYVLNVNHPAVYKLEWRSDVYVSGLRSYTMAVGEMAWGCRRASHEAVAIREL